MEKTQEEKLQAKIKSMEEIFKVWVPDLKKIRSYICTRRGRFLTDGEKPNEVRDRSKIIDTTATRAWRIMGAGMQAGLTSPSRPWFRYGLPDPALEKFRPVKQWLSDTEKAMYRLLSNTNFYPTIHGVYEEQGAYAMACMMAAEHPRNGVYYRNHTAGTYFFIINRYNEVSGLVRLISAPLQVLWDWFGDNLGDEYPKKSESQAKPYEYHTIAQLIEENPLYRPESNRIDKYSWPWRSYFMSYPGYKHLSTGGYREKPFAIVRWGSLTDEVYTEGLGHDILGDAMMIQEETRDKLKGLQKLVDPPTKAPPGLKGKVRHNPRSVTYVKASSQEALGPLYQVQFQIQHVREDIMDIRTQIEKGYMNDLFLFVAGNPYATATEIVEKHEEKLMMLGPSIEAQEHDLITPQMTRTFALGARAGKIPPPPQELVDEFVRGNIDRLKIDYISILSQAQKQIGTRSIRDVAVFATEASALDPKTPMVFNGIRAVRQFADMSGSPIEILNTDEEIAAEMERQQQMQAASNEMAVQEQQVDQMAKLGNVDMSKPNLLNLDAA